MDITIHKVAKIESHVEPLQVAADDVRWVRRLFLETEKGEHVHISLFAELPDNLDIVPT